MIDKDQARRTAVQVFFSGVDITSSLKKYFLSLTYTDNEEDKADDLQIKLQDRDGIWREKWLNSAIHKAAEYEYKEIEKKYKAISQSGVAVHSSREDKSKVLGTLAYGTVVSAKSEEDGWIGFDYSDDTGYVRESNLQPVYTERDVKTTSTTETTSNSAVSNSSGWSIGDEVTVSGRPQYSSYGTGTAGAAVTNYKGSITYLNLKSGVPYPIHVGSLGWFAESDVVKGGEQVPEQQPEGEASKGLKIQADIIRQNWHGNGEEEKLECGQFELDGVTAQGPPATVTIKGTSLPYHATIRQTKKSRSWENYTHSGIANEIASNAGMTCMFLSKTDTSYKRVEQYRISDIAFLQKLCQDAGCSLKISNNIIVIFDQAAYESRDSILTIKHGKESGYTKYKLQSGENDVYTSCRVTYVDTDGNVITATAYVDDYDEENEDNQCLKIRQKVSSVAEAEILAHNSLRLHNKYKFTASFDFPGNPALLAGCVVTLEGWGAWDGRYIIKQAKHTVDKSGYKTQITLRRALHDKSDELETATPPNAEAIDEVARAVIRGEWGNGADRKRRLTEAGYDYDVVQARVNELLR